MEKNLTCRLLQISQCVHKQFRSAVDDQTTGGLSHIFDTILRWYWVNNSEKKVKVSRLQFFWIQLEWFIHSLNAIFSYFFAVHSSPRSTSKTKRIINCGVPSMSLHNSSQYLFFVTFSLQLIQLMQFQYKFQFATFRYDSICCWITCRDRAAV